MDSASAPQLIRSCSVSRSRLLAAAWLVVAALAATPLAARPGDLDTTFGQGGTLGLANPPIWLAGDAMVHLRILNESGVARHELVRFDSNGKPDAAFGAGGQSRPALPAGTSLQAHGIAARNGSLLFPAMVSAGAPAGTRLNAVLRLRPDGSIDPSFGSTGSGLAVLNSGWSDTLSSANRGIAGLLPLQDGRILVLEAAVNCSGDEMSTWCTYRIRDLLRLSASGQLDTLFGNNGRVELSDMSEVDTPQATLFAARSDGSIAILDSGGQLRILSSAGDLSVAAALDPIVADAALLADDAMLVLERTDPREGVVALRRLRADGSLDTAWAPGGRVMWNPGQQLLRRRDIRSTSLALSASNDGQSVHAHVQLDAESGAPFTCEAILRMTATAQPDAAFGDSGVSCLHRSLGWPAIRMLRQLASGQVVAAAALPTQDAAQSLVRLTRDGSGSPGIISLQHGDHSAAESEKAIRFVVTRSAGSQGSLRVRFDAMASTAVATARPGVDFRATSGELVWGDGDRSDREIAVELVDDTEEEAETEYFTLQLAVIEGSALATATSATGRIVDNEPRAAAPPPPPSPPAAAIPESTATGGGGSLGVLSLVMLLVIPALRMRHPKLLVCSSKVHASLFLATCVALLMTDRAVARPGDLDPTWGTSGTLLSQERVELQPDGRVIEAFTRDSAILLRTFSTEGRPEALPGASNPLRLDLPATVNAGSLPSSVLQDSRGGYLVLLAARSSTTTRVELNAVMRLLPDGSPDRAFGGAGDGVAAITNSVSGTTGSSEFEAISGFIPLRDGRIVLAESDAMCGYLEDGLTCRMRVTNLIRMTAGGQLDASFGTAGRVALAGMEESAPLYLNPGQDPAGLRAARLPLFRERADGALVLLDSRGELRVLDVDGRVIHSRRLAEPAEHATLLADDRILYTQPLPEVMLNIMDAVPARQIGLVALLPDGTRDPAFGIAGSIQLSPGVVLLQREDVSVRPTGVEGAPDGGAYILANLATPGAWLNSTAFDPDFLCTAAIRVTRSGVLVPSWGTRGVACLTRGFANWTDFGFGAQPSGGLVVAMPRSSGSMLLRAMTSDTGSPGIVGLEWNFAKSYVAERDVTLKLVATRTGGTSGRITARVRSEQWTGGISNQASTGLDFLPVDATVEWQDGESADKVVALTIRNDSEKEYPEYVPVGIGDVTGGAIVDIGQYIVQIDDDESSASQPPVVIAPPPASPPASTGGDPTSGGGAVSWPWVMALLLLLSGRSWANRHAPGGVGPRWSRTPATPSAA